MIGGLRLCITGQVFPAEAAVVRRDRETERGKKRREVFPRSRGYVAGWVSSQQVLRQVLIIVYFNFSSPRSPNFSDFSSFFFALQSVLSCSYVFSASSHMLFVDLVRS